MPAASRPTSRRQFLQLGAGAVGAAFIAPAVRTVRGSYVSAAGKLRTAHVGVGGMGGSDLKSISTHPLLEVAALCDVDATRLEAALKLHPGAQTFRDYREMIAALGDKVDAVVV
ncbi:MAG: Gfo/Idh/MocA family oxidoreductase, partial [Planctomycetales bacterium]|nr:Gfo/Idh/MocA family oxidoreductase [Planctomycetales bacterium]